MLPYRNFRKEIHDYTLTNNPLGGSPLVLSHFEKLKTLIADYPNPGASVLKKYISDYLQIGIDNIIIAAGSDSLIYVAIQNAAKQGKVLIMTEPTFPLISVITSQIGMRTYGCKLREDFTLDIELLKESLRKNKNNSILYLTNPNVPTGELINKTDLIDILREAKDTGAITVVDEAFIELYPRDSVIQLATEDNSLIVTRTFSKLYGLAGLRVGYAVSSEQIIKQLERWLLPFPISTVAENCAILALEDQKFLEKSTQYIRAQSLYMHKKISEMGLSVSGGGSMTLLVKIPDKEGLKKFLRLKNISVLYDDDFPGMGSAYIRIAIRTKKENMYLIKTIEEYLNEYR